MLQWAIMNILQTNFKNLSKKIECIEEPNQNFKSEKYIDQYIKNKKPSVGELSNRMEWQRKESVNVKIEQ